MSTEAKGREPKPWTPPEHISFPVLDLQTTRLKDFASEGRLTPTPEDERRLFLELWKKACKDRPNYPEDSPLVLDIDFDGIRSGRIGTVQDVLVSALALFRGQPNSAYAYLDNLTGEADISISGVLEESRKPALIVARNRGSDTFDLIGSDTRRDRFKPI